jgi:hypothetical protein
MVFADDVRSRTNTLLVARGQTVTPGIIERMRNLPPGHVKEPVRMLIEGQAVSEA